ncbi:MAG TPA: mandelate racemase/muconate lactonizing enzyme family protein [Candidatus Limnocylindria bacterium]|nr:mandelate racemase/muconate lactonizing enzyme family protein [Candidatus Limnocylindria bacterium]
MKIATVESLHADAGQRTFDFLKITTDDGLVGWSEYNESFGGPGVSAVIERLVPVLIGKDPRAYEALVALMYAMRRQASGGVVQQAIGAIENALLDVKARALGIPVYELLGGPVRDRIRLYWSHCGTYRLAWAKEMQLPPLRTLQDCVTAGKEVVARGYTALKTNVFLLGAQPRLHSPGFARAGDGFPELNAERHVLRALRDQLAAFREGAGKDVDILVDLNFNFKTEGFLKVARAIEPFDIFWVEIDTRDPRALAYIRARAGMPVASCECLFGRRDYRPFLESQAVDVAIIDTPWNGVAESVKIAAMADACEVNVAPHNFYGHLATMMNAHFCAVVPNLRIMEIDPDTVPWYDDLVTHTPAIKDGHLLLPTRPGWGTEVNEAAVRAHPPRKRS